MGGRRVAASKPITTLFFAGLKKIARCISREIVFRVRPQIAQSETKKKMFFVFPRFLPKPPTPLLVFGRYDAFPKPPSFPSFHCKKLLPQSVPKTILIYFFHLPKSATLFQNYDFAAAASLTHSAILRAASSSPSSPVLQQRKVSRVSVCKTRRTKSDTGAAGGGGDGGGRVERMSALISSLVRGGWCNH